jgi:hypothetical protein
MNHAATRRLTVLSRYGRGRRVKAEGFNMTGQGLAADSTRRAGPTSLIRRAVLRSRSHVRATFSRPGRRPSGATLDNGANGCGSGEHQ